MVEIKTRELQPKDIGQLEFYVNTIGLLVVKKNNRYVIEYTTNNDLYITTYNLL